MSCDFWGSKVSHVVLICLPRLHQAYSARAYRLVRESIKIKLSTAAWPVWGAALVNMRTSSDESYAISARRAAF